MGAGGFEIQGDKGGREYRVDPAVIKIMFFALSYNSTILNKSHLKTFRFYLKSSEMRKTKSQKSRNVRMGKCCPKTEID